MEPILGEGGIVPLTCSFLKGTKNLCEKYNLLLILMRCKVVLAGLDIS